MYSPVELERAGRPAGSPAPIYADGRHISSRRRQKAALLAAEIDRRCGERRGLTLVDLGTADGAIPRLILESGVGDRFASARAFTLLDYNPLPIKVFHRHPRLAIAVKDCTGRLDRPPLPVDPGSADLVTATAFFHYLDRPGRALAAARRALKPGGLMLVTIPARWVLALYRSGLAGAGEPNTRIRWLLPARAWGRFFERGGFEILAFRRVQLTGKPRWAGLEQRLERAGVLRLVGANLFYVLRRREP